MCALILHQFEHCRPAVYGAFSRQALILLHFSSCQSAPRASALAPGPHIARAAAVERRDRLADPVSSEESEREYPSPLPDQLWIGTISMCALIWFQFRRSFQPSIGTISALCFIWFQFPSQKLPSIGTISALSFNWFQFTLPGQSSIGTISTCEPIWFQFTLRVLYNISVEKHQEARQHEKHREERAQRASSEQQTYLRDHSLR